MEETTIKASTDPVATAPVKPVPTEYAGCKSHVVKADETLYDIANDNVVALEQLRYFNHMKHNNTRVHEGQVIYIPNKPVYVPAGE